MKVLKITRSGRWEMDIVGVRNTVLAAVKLIFTAGCRVHVESVEGCESITH